MSTTWVCWIWFSVTKRRKFSFYIISLWSWKTTEWHSLLNALTYIYFIGLKTSSQMGVQVSEKMCPILQQVPGSILTANPSAKVNWSSTGYLSSPCKVLYTPTSKISSLKAVVCFNRVIWAEPRWISFFVLTLTQVCKYIMIYLRNRNMIKLSWKTSKAQSYSSLQPQCLRNKFLQILSGGVCFLCLQR